MARIIDEGGSFPSTPPVTIKADGTAIEIADAALLFNADFSRSGSDLVLVGADGKTIIIIDYFAAGQAADLLSSDGAVLSADVVAALAGPLAPGQYAQTGTTPAGNTVIGQVETLTGTATATRQDGTVVELKIGTHVFQGDVIQTGDGSSLGITFLDQTVFSLSDNARMVLNELVYDPGGSSNSMLMNLVQGSFVFVAGQIAPTGDMKIQTPVATMGIRGTSPTVFIADNGTVAFSIIPDPGPEGKVGNYVLFDSQGQVIGSVTGTGSKLILTSAAGQVQELAKTAGDFAQDQQVQAQVYSVFNSLQGRIDSGQSPVELNSTATDPDTTPDNPDAPSDQSQNTPADGAPEVTGSIDTTPSGGGIGESNFQSTTAPETTATDPLDTGTDNTGQGPAVDPLGGASDPVISNTPASQPLSNPTDNPVTSINQISGTPGNDFLTGTSGNDVIQGLDGPDILIGGAGNDILDGGPGADTLTGGAGADTFILGADAPDSIIDFNVAEDTLDLSSLLGPNFDIANLSDFVNLQETGSSTVRIDSDGAANGRNFVDVAVLEDIFAGDSLNFIFDAQGTTGSVVSADRNVAPVAQDDIFATNEDTGINGNVLADNGNGPDVDPENEQLVVVEVNGSAANVGTPVILASGALLTLNADGTFAYDPNGQFEDLNSTQSATDTFSYTLNDGKDGFDTATVDVNITGVNDAPVTGVVQLAATEDGGPVTGTFNASDVDAGGAAVSFDIVTQPAGGTVVNNNDGTFTFSPGTALQSLAQGVTQELVFTFTATDNEGAVSAPGNATITITGENDAPTAIDDTFRTKEDRIINGDVFEDNTDGEDEDIDINDDFSVVQVNGSAADVGTGIVLPSGALLTLDADGIFEYDPNGQFDTLAFGQSAIDSYTYTIQDTQGASDTATDTIIINGVNDAPVITSAATAQVAENTSAVQQVTATDIDAGSQLAFSLTGNGTDDALFSIDAQTGLLNFQTPPDFENPLDSGNDNVYNVEVAVSDGTDTTTRLIAVTVTDGNDNAPVITSATVVNVAENTTAVQQVTASDTDTVGTQIFSLTANGPDNALFTIDANGNLSFLAAPDFENPVDVGINNVYNVEVAVSDGVNPAATQAIEINVTDLNDNTPVIISANSADVAENTTFALQIIATDPDQIGAQTFSLTGNGPDDGLFTIDGLGNLRFQASPDFENPLDTGADNVYNIDVAVSDGVTTTTQAIAVSVTDVNEAPVARDDGFNTDEDTDIFSNVLADNGAGADLDPDNNPLTITQVNGQAADVGIEITLASGASLNLSGNGDFLYDTNISGSFESLPVGGVAQDSFTYTISDGNGGFDTATATINISGVNDAPVARADAVATGENTILNGNVFADNGNGIDFDVDNGDVINVLEINGVTADVGVQTALASGALLTLNADGTFAYDPNGQFNALNNGETATDTFDYTVDDGNGGTDTATATVTISGVDSVNTAPVAEDDFLGITEDSELSANLFDDNSGGPDFDSDGDTLTITQFNGTGFTGFIEATLDSGASISIIENGNFNYSNFGVFDFLSEGELFEESFTYTISDGNGGFDTAEVLIEITGENDDPAALDDAVSTDENTVLNGDVFADNGSGTDFDVDNGDAFSVTELDFNAAALGVPTALTSGALVTLNGDGTFAYDPNGQFELLGAGQTTTDSFDYTIEDGNGGFSSATTTVTVTGVNDAPVAQDDEFFGDEDFGFNGNVLVDNGNGPDSDPENDPRTVTAVNGQAANIGALLLLASGALLTLNADGSFAYDPDGAFENLSDGEIIFDGFDYTISDGNGGFSTATANIEVLGANDAPVVVFGPNEQFATVNSAFFTDFDPLEVFFDIDDFDILSLDAQLDNGDLLPNWLTFDGADFFGTPTAIDGGIITVELTGSDELGDLDSVIFDIIVSGDILGTSGNDNLQGNAFANLIQGFGGNDRIAASLGGDVIDGGLGNDTISFINNTQSVTVNLLTESASSAETGNDTLISIENVIGGAGDDDITGDASNNTLFGRGGDDTIDGGAGNDRIDGGSGFNRLVGGAGNDTIFGTATGDINGGNVADYSSATGAVTVNLSGSVRSFASSATGNASVGTDILDTIDTVTGSDFADSFTITRDFLSQFSDGFNQIRGEGGDDIIFGNGATRVDYRDANAGVTVDFEAALGDPQGLTGRAQLSVGSGGPGDNVGVDSFTGVNSVSGSEFDDTVLGSNGNQFESFRLRGGNDTVDGRGGDNDQLDYRFSSPTGIVASFNTNATDGSGTVQDGFGTVDTFSNIERIRGTEFDDIITGDGSNNIFIGLGGNDVIDGGGGNDILFGGFGDNRLVGGAGNDILIGAATLDNDLADFNRVEYRGAGAGITVNLTGGIDSFTSTVTGDVSVGTDTLVNVEFIFGSIFADTFTIDGTFANRFGNFIEIEGGAGDDIITGNGGTRLGYITALDSVTVDLGVGAAASTNIGDTANIGNDTFTGVDSVRGSNFDDILIGSNSANFESFRGQAGNDFIDGGAGGSDQSDYRNSPGGIVVDLSGGAIGDGTAQDGFGSVDTLVGIENIRASNFDDILIGDAGDNVFRPRSGDDTITGGLGNDTIRYSQIDDDQIIDLSAGTATGARIGNDTFTGIENAIGGGGNDLIIGDAGDNLLRGGLGDNTLIGGAGNDILRGASTVNDSKVDFNRVDYRGATAGITVNLSGGLNSTTSTATGDASVGTDTLINAEFIFGTSFADTFTVDNTFNQRFGNFVEIEGGAGNDVINGNGGVRISFGNALAGVTVDFAGGTANSTASGDVANVGLDTFTGVNNVRGSGFADILIGSDGAQFESFRGQAGDDFIDGRGGLIDQADYRNSPNGIIVDLSTGTAEDGFLDAFGNVGIDTLVNIERIRGSEFADTITGDANDNQVLGRDGADLIDGGAGDDDLRGGDGQDLIRGGAGNDAITGGADADTLFGGLDNDTIDGGDGNDRIAGEAGIDTLTGGFGNDTFVLDLLARDLVTDFNIFQDQLDLSSILNVSFTIPALDDFVRSIDDGATTIVSIDSDGAANGVNFVEVAELTGVVTGNSINFIFDNQSAPASVVTTAAVTGAPASIELSALDGTNGFVINGVAAVDGSGFSVSLAGDINGDGFDDVIIGASNADPNGSSSGASYVVFGKAGGFSASLELSSLDGTNGFVINGVTAFDSSGSSVSSAGDLNGDGLADVIIGANGADLNGNASGASYVVFGQAGGFGASLNLSSLNGRNGFVLNGIDTNDQSGLSVSSAGDVNDDGFDDLIIGALRGDPNGSDTGESYVVFGRAGDFGASLELSSLDGANGFVINGIAANDQSGGSVSSAGDINGDGIADVIIGAKFADPNGSSSGAGYVVFGTDAGFGASFELATLNGTNGFVINGINPSDRSGVSVSSAGDINGDGFDDLIIGADGADPNGLSSGQSYVVFGKAASFGPSFELSSLDGTNGFTLNGISLNDLSGESVSSAGDVNGDGFDDLIISGRLGDTNATQAGEAYVVFGKAAGFSATLELSALDGSDGFVLNGINFSDQAGGSVSSAGDVNGDGFDDLIVGAELGDPNGTNSGESYIIFGAAFGLGSAPITATGTTAANILIGGLGNDLLIGNGGADVIRGGAGDDIIAISDDFFARIDGGTGIDTLRFDGAGLNPNSPGGNGIITGIERIDITGSGDNTILLDKPDVFTITDERSGGIASITVTGDAGDAVSFDDLGWSNAGQITIGADTFNRIINGNAEVLVQDTVGTVIPGAQASVIELATLNGTNGFVLNGVAGSDFSGGSVSSAGDVNGDGFDDVIIGARLADFNGGVDVGTSYVVFGNGSGFGPNFNLSSLNGINGFAINGINSNGQSGFSVAYAGDINNDGFDDVIIGAPGTVLNNNGAGASYVVFGQAGGFGANLSLSSLNGSNGFAINGVNAGDSSGSSVSSAGDINGDGIDDVIIGAVGADPNGSFSGASYVVFGQAGGFSASLGLASLNGTNGFVINGVAASDQSGRSVSAAGDINGDGIGDVIVSAPLADPNGLASGASYVVFGKSSGFGASLELSSLDGTNGFVINGVFSNDLSGRSVSSAGDINNDGFDDVIIGAERADPNGNSSGESYVVFGRAGGFGASFELSALDGTNGFVINGIDTGDQSGISVSSAGDVNGDGFGDVIIGAETADGVNGSDSGESYVVFGKAGGFSATLELSTLDGTNGFIIKGIDGGDRSGGSVSSAGDVNNDGFDDLIIGADLADPNGTNSGESYIIFGSPFGNGVILGTPGNDNLIGTTGTDILRGLGSDDTLQGINGDDLLLGGAGNDELLGGSDNDILDGETGIDSLTGGPGFDIFRFTDATAVDTVTDFTIGQDQLDLSQLLDASFTGANVNDFIRISETDGNAIISVDSDGLTNGENFIDVGNLTGIVKNDNISILFNNGLSNTNVTVTAGSGLNQITGTAFEDNIVGTLGADIINGLGGGDALLGLDGDDILFGGTGIDLLRGGGGDDVLIGGANINALTGGAGFDLFVFDSLGVNLVTDFSINDDTLDFSSLLGGNFTIPAQDDFIRATSAGSNTIISIDGDGSLNGANFSAVAILSGIGSGSVITTLSTTLISNAPPVVISGTGGDDGLVGTAGDDFIEGLAGNDVLDGGSSGVDALSGGAGADIFVLDLQGVDLVTDFNSAEDILDLSGPLLAGGSFTVGAVDDFIDITDLGGTSVISIDFDGLNNGDNFIPVAILPTVAGNELVTFIFDGTGTTATVQSQPDFNVITGTPAGETRTGTLNGDVITAFAGDDTLFGLGDDDLLLGGEGNDVLFGDAGFDFLNGGTGDDFLSGGDDDDILIGGAGNDVLDGGGGNNTLTGGSEFDVFLFSDTFGAPRFDTITDFNLVDDTLDLTDLLDANFTIGTQNDFIKVIDNGLGDSVLNVDADGAGALASFEAVAVLEGIVAGDSVDFIFDIGLAGTSNIVVA